MLKEALFEPAGELEIEGSWGDNIRDAETVPPKKSKNDNHAGEKLVHFLKNSNYANFQFI